VPARKSSLLVGTKNAFLCLYTVTESMTVQTTATKSNAVCVLWRVIAPKASSKPGYKRL